MDNFSLFTVQGQDHQDPNWDSAGLWLQPAYNTVSFIFLIYGNHAVTFMFLSATSICFQQRREWECVRRSHPDHKFKLRLWSLCFGSDYVVGRIISQLRSYMFSSRGFILPWRDPYVVDKNRSFAISVQILVLALDNRNLQKITYSEFYSSFV